MTRFGSERSDRQKRTNSWSSSWKEPANKRSRFEDDTYEPQLNRKIETSTRTMLTYKKFLDTLDQDSLSDEEAIAKYTDYKFEFRKQEYEKFFEAHKEEEW